MPHDPSIGRCVNCIAPIGARCPHWIGPEDGILETNPETREQRVFVGCSCGAFQARMARYIIGTMDRYTAEMSAGRADMEAAIQRVITHSEYSRKSVIRALQEATKQASRAEVLEKFADVLIEHRGRVPGSNGA